MIGYMRLDDSVKDDKKLDACSEHDCEFYTSTSRIANLL